LNNLKARVIVVLFLILIATVSFAASEISYDDGSAELMNPVYNYQAVKISPITTGTLDAVKVYAYSPSGTDPYFTYATGNLFNTLDSFSFATLPSATPTFQMNYQLLHPVYSSDFYIGVQKLGSTDVEIGYDTTAPTGRSFFANSAPGDYNSESTANYMIRAIFNYHPMALLVAVSPDPTNGNPNPVLTGTCTDLDSDIGAAQYRIDSGSWNPMAASDGSFDSSSEGVKVTIDIVGLALLDGNHTADVRCIDSEGAYISNTSGTTFFVDTVNPTVLHILNPASPNGDNGWYRSTVEITLNANDAPPSSGIDRIEYTIGSTNIYTNPFTISAEGFTAVTYEAFDNAGNDSVDGNLGVMIDTVAPDIPDLNAFPNAFISGTSETVNWSASTDATSGISHYDIYRSDNGGAFNFIGSTAGTETWYLDSGLLEGSHDYRIVAIDNAGNESAQSNVEGFTVDLTGPTAPVLSSLPPYVWYSDVGLSWTAAIDLVSGVAHYDFEENTIISALGNVLSFTDAGNTDATQHDYRVRGVDNVANDGNWSNQETTRIDLTPPVSSYSINPSSPDGLSGWYVMTPAITLSAIDPNDINSGVNRIDYCLDSFGSCSVDTKYMQVPFPLPDGSNYITFMARDKVNNPETPQTTGPFKVDLTAPSGQSISFPGNPYNTQDVNAVLDSGFDVTSGLDYCQISWDYNTGIWDINVSSGTTNLGHHFAEGETTVGYRCFDVAGNAGNRVTALVIIDITPPISMADSPADFSSVIKGKTTISGTSTDNLSGVAQVEIQVQHNTQSGWVTVLDWANTNLTIPNSTFTTWNYEWDNSSLPEGEYRVNTRATDVATNVETPDEKLRFNIEENDSSNLENVYYENGSDKKNLLYGYLQRTNTEYTVEVFQLLNGLDAPAEYTYHVTTDSNAFFTLDLNVTDWDLNKLYGARITLESGRIIYVQFDTMAIAYLQTQIDLAFAQLLDLYGITDNLGLTDQHLQSQIDDLNSSINNIELRLDDLNAMTTDLQNQIDAIQMVIANLQVADANLQSQINAINAQISGLVSDINDLQLADQSLQNQIDILESRVSTLEAMDLVLQSQIDTANARIDDQNANLILFKSDYDAFMAQYANDQNAIWEQFNDVDSNLMAVWSEFDSVWSEFASVHTEIDDLRNLVEDMDVGTVWISYHRDENNGTLYVKGKHKRILADYALIRFLDLDFTDVFPESEWTIAYPDSRLEYQAVFTNVNDWNAQMYNVSVQFIDADDNNRTIGHNVNAQFYALAYLANFQGFNFQSDWIKEYCYVRPDYLPSSFSFGAVETGIYDFNIVATDGNTTVNNYLFSNYMEKYHNRNFHAVFNVPYDANWSVHLVASKNGIIMGESNSFNLYVVDDCSLFTAYTDIISPVVNSNTSLPFPYGSIASDVFWTQSGTVNLVSHVGTNTAPTRPTCELDYYSTDIQSTDLGTFDISSIGSQSWACDTQGEVSTNNWGNTNHKSGQYTKIRVYNDAVGQSSSYDELKVGIDNAVPLINSIDPDVNGFINGVYRVYSSVEDNLSGISQVDFYLIEKDGIDYCVGLDCHIGDGNVVWPQLDVPFDTNINKFYWDLNTLLFPDGDYNIAVGATDIAGNYGYLEIDPTIDNTPPTISTTDVTPNPIPRGNMVTIDVNASDKLTGIDSVIATIKDPASATIKTLVLSGSGNIYTGTFDTNSDWNIGTYNVTVDVNDMAGNINSKSIDINVFENYSFSLSLSDSSVETGTIVTLSGQLISDTGRQVSDENVFVSGFFGSARVETDANGSFSYTFTPNTTGTLNIAVKYTDENRMYSDSMNLNVTNPTATPAPASTPPAISSSGSGGGGGSGGDSSASRLLVVNPSAVNVGEDVTVSALCKWAFGCKVYADGKLLDEISNSAGFQDFAVSFDTPGEKLAELYWKGTTDTLVASKTVTVNEVEEVVVEEPVVEETNSNSGTGNTDTTPTETNNQPEEPPAEPETPTGFFGLGNLDLAGFSSSPLMLLIALLIGLAMIFRGRKVIFK